MEKFLKDIEEKGWTIIRNYSSDNICDEIKKTLEINQFCINTNDPLPTQRGSYITNKHVLSSSKEVFKLVTKKQIRDLANKFIGEKSILKNARTYSIKKGDPRFPWHADNILPNGKYDNSKGIVCILYLVNDTEEGSFWLSDFKSWDKKRNKKIYPTKEEFSNWESGKDVTKIKARKGDLFIFNQNLYHRHIAKKYNVDALFFQIIGESVQISEKIIIDLSMVSEFDEDLLSYLGLGKSNVGFSNPKTDIKDLSAFELIKIIFKSIFLIPKALINHSLIISNLKQYLYWKKKIRLSKLFKL